MLRVLDVHAEDRGRVDLDEYVPLSFHVHDVPMARPYYWVIRSDPYSLMELKIDRYNAAVLEAILVNTGTETVDSLPRGYYSARHRSGLPVVDTSPFMANQFGAWTEHRAIYFFRTPDAAYVLFDPALDPTDCLAVDRIRFFVAGDALSGVAFTGLTADEIVTLNDCLARKNYQGAP